MTSNLYADILLPLKLDQAFSYIIPEDLQSKVEIGKRVLVSFGRAKLYSGIIVKVHSVTPEYPNIKEVQEVLDDKPILFESQLNLWKWLASYYMCTMGEVMDTALPNYFKLSNERFYKISEDETRLNIGLSIMEEDSDIEMLFDAIRSMGQISIKEIKDSFGSRKGVLSLNKLIDIGVVEPIDVVKDKYKVRYEKFIRIAERYRQNESLNQLFKSLEKRSSQQYKAVLTYFSLEKKETKILKSDLIKESDTNSSIVKALVNKEVFEEYQEQVDRFALKPHPNPKKPCLSKNQESAVLAIREQFQSKPVVLLRGITGSGKTEIYINLIQDYIAHGKTCLFILPEIALTQQIVSRLNEYFGDQFLVYHSLVSQNKRFEIWKKVYEGKIKFIVGTRSALFLPFKNLDLAIVDEEHDAALKQTGSHPKFHLRDSIVYYSRYLGTKILLGSATPSVETYFNVLKDRYGYVELLERYGNALVPEIELINLRDEEVRSTLKSFYSGQLLSKVKEVVSRGEQAILFQNRRGYSPYIQCNTCGFIQKCDSCDVRLTYHTTHKLLVCHYCNKKYTMSSTCAECKSTELRTKGLGTQKVEEEVQLFLPNLKSARLDIDSASSSGKIDKLLDEFRNKQYDVLIGTQMIAKGLDFENLTLLGVLQADNLFSFIDYKTDEKAFQTLSQVSGRVGRGDKVGKVLIQTSEPQNRVIQFVLNNDWKGFAEQELKNRESFIYPPYCKLIKISIRHLKEDLVKIYADKIAKRVADNIKALVFGPSSPPVARIRNQYIQEIVIKLPKNKEISKNKSIIKQIIDTELMTLSNKNFTIDILVDV